MTGQRIIDDDIDMPRAKLPTKSPNVEPEYNVEAMSENSNRKITKAPALYIFFFFKIVRILKTPKIIPVTIERSGFIEGLKIPFDMLMAALMDMPIDVIMKYTIIFNLLE